MIKKKGVIIALWALLIIAVLGVVFLRGNHRVIAEEEAKIIAKSMELYTPFKNNQVEITASYIDQVAQITGNISSVSKHTIELDEIIQVDLLDSLSILPKKGKTITIKGRCVGYDDLFEVVKIDQAIILP